MKGLAKNLKSDTHAAAIKWSAKKKPNGNPAPPLQRHWDSVQPGLILAVRRSPGKNETGRKVWQVRANSIIEKTGKQSQSILKLGNFPAMGLDQARAKAALIREQANIGADVKITQQSNGLDTTVNTLFEAMFDLPRNGVARYPLQKRSAGYRYALEKTYYKHIAPQLGKMRIKGVTAEHWRDLIIEDVFLTQNKRGSASVLLGLCSTFYRNLKFHADPAIRTLENPLRGLPLAEKIGKFTRDRVLTIQELADLWNGFNDPIHQAVIRVMILTGQRISEILRMCWDAKAQDDDDNVVWCVGLRGEMKSKSSAHYLPLTSALEKAVEPMKQYCPAINAG